MPDNNEPYRIGKLNGRFVLVFDDINGNQGNDTAHGNAGDDWVVGGKDNDTAFFGHHSPAEQEAMARR